MCAARIHAQAGPTSYIRYRAYDAVHTRYLAYVLCGAVHTKDHQFRGHLLRAEALLFCRVLGHLLFWILDNLKMGEQIGESRLQDRPQAKHTAFRCRFEPRSERTTR